MSGKAADKRGEEEYAFNMTESGDAGDRTDLSDDPVLCQIASLLLGAAVMGMGDLYAVSIEEPADSGSLIGRTASDS